MFRRGNDARKKSAILLVYTVDVDLADEADVLARWKSTGPGWQTRMADRLSKVR